MHASRLRLADSAAIVGAMAGRGVAVPNLGPAAATALDLAFEIC